MRKLLSIFALAMIFSGGLIGCEASARIDDDGHHDDSTYKKTTVRQPDGDTTVKTEIRRD